MERIEYRLPVREGTPLYVCAWIPPSPRAVLQVAHGMAEHALRYDDFARAMAAQGIAVYVNDHRGHGRSCEPSEQGYFYKEDGWRRVVGDLRAVSDSIAERHPGLPLVLLGHSMGSFLARSYIAAGYADALAGVILSGTAGPNPLLPLGKLLAAVGMRLLPAGKPCKWIDAVAFSSHNKPFAPARTAFDWLSRDTKAVDAYIADPACGFPFTATGYRDLFAGLSEISRDDWAAKAPKALPVLLISGERDPVGNMGKGVRWVERALREAGVREVDCILYPGARHEPLNEINREEAYADIVSWMRRILAAPREGML